MYGNKHTGGHSQCTWHTAKYTPHTSADFTVYIVQLYTTVTALRLYRCTGLKLQRNPGFVYTRGKHQSKRRADFEASRPRRLFCQVPGPAQFWTQNCCLPSTSTRRHRRPISGLILEATHRRLPFLPRPIRGQINPITHVQDEDDDSDSFGTMMEICSTRTLFQFNFARSLSAAKMELLLGRRNA